MKQKKQLVVLVFLLLIAGSSILTMTSRL